MTSEPQPSAKRRKARRILGAAIAFDALGTLVARALGYGIGPRTIVRCRHGHLFTTVWIPGASVKSLRLGWWRVQRCPVGGHWTLVHPVREASLGRLERRRAAARHDVRLP